MLCCLKNNNNNKIEDVKVVGVTEEDTGDRFGGKELICCGDP